MSTLSYLPLKIGDLGVTARYRLLNEATGLPSDLTGLTDIRVAYRSTKNGPVLLTKSAVIYGDPANGEIEHTWDDVSEHLTLFGDPEDSTIEVVWRWAEIEGLRGGKPVSWPTEGKVRVRVERDVVEDGS